MGKTFEFRGVTRWMPWSGGENPVPGQRVDFQEADGATNLVNCASEVFDVWHKPGRFRLAPAAPVEASGSEREHGPKCWGMTSASDEMAHCYCGSTDIRPQPSGETREQVARIVDPAAFLFKADELMKGDTSQYDAFNKADRILALIRPAPVASGERLDGSEVEPDLVTAASAQARIAELEADLTKVIAQRDSHWDEYIAERQARMEHGAREAGYLDIIPKLTDRAAAAEARADRLAKALDVLQDLFAREGECSMERFERIAEMFRKDTGYLAPGKDPGMLSQQPEGDELRRIYDEWYAAKITDARAALQQEG